MILNKIYRHFKESKILDIKYIIVEIALIFAGITLAAKYNNYQNQLKDEAFLKETITLIHSDIKNNISEANRCNKSYNEYEDDLFLLRNVLINKNIDSLNSIFFKENILLIALPYPKINNNVGYQTLVNKNISLLKNSELRYELISYYEEVKVSQDNIDLINLNTVEALKTLNKTFLIKDHIKSEIIINDNEEIFKNKEFYNSITTSIMIFEGLKGDNKYIIINFGEKLLKNLEKEYPFLKEENKQ